MNNWSVYIHTSPHGKKYVGIASQKPSDRWRNGKGYKYNSHFTRAINKYGWNNFKHEILFSGLSEEDAKEMEIRLISDYETTNQDKGYNLSLGGDGTTGVSHYGESNPFYGRQHSDETKKVLSDNMKDLWKSGQIGDAICKPIYQFDLDGNYLNSYCNVREAEKITGVPHSVISRVCKGKLNYTHGYTWAYQEKCDNLEKFQKDYLERIKNKHNKLSDNSAKSKKVILYDLCGNEIGIYKSASEIARLLNLHKDTISFACRNNSIVQNKYKCKYIGGV